MALKVSAQIALVASTVGVLTGFIAIYEFIVPLFSCPSFDLTGKWTMITKVKHVALEEYNDELGKTHTFSLTLHQKCKDIDGRATKTIYDGKTVYGPAFAFRNINTKN